MPRPDYTNPQILAGVTATSSEILQNDFTTSSEVLQNDFDAEEHETKEELESHVDFSWWNNDLTEGEEE